MLQQMDFTTLPTEALHRYLVQYDLIPMVHPSPLTVHDPPPPPSLLESTTRSSSRGLSPPVTTPANRPRRESREQSRRRSSRFLEEEVRMRTPVLADVGEVQNVLASIAQRHFESQVVKEVDSLASFIAALVSLVLPFSHSTSVKSLPFVLATSNTMKFSAALTTFVFILPLLSGQAFVEGQRNNGKNQGNKGAAPPPPPPAKGAANNTGAANKGAGAGGDPQTSLTLDPKVISAGFEKNGQEVPTAGQVASLTSSNNFINFCLTVNKPLTNGLQTKTGLL
ncbi:hypothetical protein EDB85DRAFT_2206043 [Lactarius pseudohatsudake]|nr:hypothetical protein EDB85DRAFT_2206043 [Lactarius pseudohatsudake]